MARCERRAFTELKAQATRVVRLALAGPQPLERGESQEGDPGEQRQPDAEPEWPERRPWNRTLRASRRSGPPSPSENSRPVAGTSAIDIIELSRRVRHARFGAIRRRAG